MPEDITPKQEQDLATTLPIQSVSVPSIKLPILPIVDHPAVIDHPATIITVAPHSAMPTITVEPGHSLHLQADNQGCKFTMSMLRGQQQVGANGQEHLGPNGSWQWGPNLGPGNVNVTITNQAPGTLTVSF